MQYERRNHTSPKQKPLGHGSEAVVLAELNTCLVLGSYNIEEILGGGEAINLAPRCLWGYLIWQTKLKVSENLTCC